MFNREFVGADLHELPLDFVSSHACQKHVLGMVNQLTKCCQFFFLPFLSLNVRINGDFIDSSLKLIIQT